MKLFRKNPCNECPFREKSIPGWLGPWTPDTIIQQAHSPVGLPCHKSYDPLLRKGMDVFQAMDEAHVCVGSLQHANRSCKRYEIPSLRDMAKAVGIGDGILDIFTFRKHHERFK